jgi:hypothetical protein
MAIDLPTIIASLSHNKPNTSQGPTLIRIIWTLLALSIVVVALRLAAKLVAARRIFVDDLLMVAALLLAIVHAVLIQISVDHGLGRHVIHVKMSMLSTTLRVGSLSLLFGFLSPVFGLVGGWFLCFFSFFFLVGGLVVGVCLGGGEERAEEEERKEKGRRRKVKREGEKKKSKERRGKGKRKEKEGEKGKEKREKGSSDSTGQDTTETEDSDSRGVEGVGLLSLFVTWLAPWRPTTTTTEISPSTCHAAYKICTVCVCTPMQLQALLYYSNVRAGRKVGTMYHILFPPPPIIQ